MEPSPGELIGTWPRYKRARALKIGLKSVQGRGMESECDLENGLESDIKGSFESEQLWGWLGELLGEGMAWRAVLVF